MAPASTSASASTSPATHQVDDASGLPQEP